MTLKMRESPFKFNEDLLGYCILAIRMVKGKKKNVSTLRTVGGMGKQVCLYVSAGVHCSLICDGNWEYSGK